MENFRKCHFSAEKLAAFAKKHYFCTLKKGVFRPCFSQEAKKRKAAKTFANFLGVHKPMITSVLSSKGSRKLRHLNAKKHGICEKTDSQKDKRGTTRELRTTAKTRL